MKKVSTALLLSALFFGSASAQTQTVLDQPAVANATAARELPESAQAVRRILESRGLLNTPAPTQLPALRGLPISDSLRALLPNAVWGDEMTGMAVTPPTAPAPVLVETTMPVSTATETVMLETEMEALPVTEEMTAEEVSMDPTTAEIPASEAAEVAPNMSETPAAAAPQGAIEEAQETPDANILVMLEADGRFGTFLELLNAAGLEEALLVDEYTVLIPTDEAFSQLPASQLEALKANPALLEATLSNHVLPGLVSLSDQPLTSVLGYELPSLTSGSEAIESEMTRAYAIDQVLVPQDVLDALQ